LIRHSLSSFSLSPLVYFADDRFERALIESAIAAEGGSITKAARRMGIERSRLGKLKKRFCI